jgi:hypothetical protein
MESLSRERYKSATRKGPSRFNATKPSAKLDTISQAGRDWHQETAALKGEVFAKAAADLHILLAGKPAGSTER